MSDPCPGPCNRAHREATQAYQQAAQEWVAARDAWQAAGSPGRAPQPPDPVTTTPTAGTPVWCRRCTGAVRAALGDLDTLAAIAAATADGYRVRTGASDDRVATTSTEAPSPSPAADLLDELYGDLALIERQWREVRDYGSPPGHSRGASALTGTIARLLRHLDDILTWTGSEEWGLQVLRWQRVLQYTTRTRPSRQRRTLPCPRCDRRTLIAEEDRGLVRCENTRCGHTLSADEYDAHATALGGVRP